MTTVLVMEGLGYACRDNGLIFSLNAQMESVINTYISRELVSNPELLPLKNDMTLLESGIMDSLSVLKLTLFLEQQFRVVVAPEELIPDNFGTIDAICRYLRVKQQK